jgi:hypothetical protein
VLSKMAWITFARQTSDCKGGVSVLGLAQAIWGARRDK